MSDKPLNFHGRFSTEALDKCHLVSISRSVIAFIIHGDESYVYLQSGIILVIDCDQVSKDPTRDVGSYLRASENVENIEKFCCGA